MIGSSNALRYRTTRHGGSIVYLAEPDVFDDGPAKPVRIWSRIGRRPLAGRRELERRRPDAAVRRRSRPRPALRLLVLHDDAEREFDYTAGAENALERAAEQGWTVVSVKNDWSHRLRRRHVAKVAGWLFPRRAPATSSRG